MGRKGRRSLQHQPSERRSASRWQRLWLAALALWLGAWALRAAFLASGIDRSHPGSVFFHGDALLYWEYAGALLEGRLFDSGLPFHPPLFAWLLAGIRRLLGAEAAFRTARALLAPLGALAVPLVWEAGRRFFGETAALAAAVSTALGFAGLVFSTTSCSEAVAQPLLLAAVALCAAMATARESGAPGGPASWISCLLLGGLAGLGALARAEQLLLIPVFAAWAGFAFWRRESRSRALAAIGVTLAAAVLVILPWSLHASRNIARFNSEQGARLPAPLPTRVAVTSYGALNFALANHSRAAAGFSRALLPESSSAAGLDLTTAEHHRLYTRGYEAGLTFIRETPSAWTRLAAAKLRVAASGLAFGWGFRNWPAGLESQRRPVDIAAPRHDWLKWPVGALAVAGLALALRQRETRPAAVLIGVILAHRLAMTALFFGYVRGIAFVLPLVHLLAGYAIVTAWQRLRGTEGAATGRWTAAACGVVLLLIGLFARGGEEPSRYYGLFGTSDAPGTVIDDEPLAIWPAQRGSKPRVPDWAKTWTRRTKTELREGVLAHPP